MTSATIAFHAAHTLCMAPSTSLNCIFVCKHHWHAERIIQSESRVERCQNQGTRKNERVGRDIVLSKSVFRGRYWIINRLKPNKRLLPVDNCRIKALETVDAGTHFLCDNAFTGHSKRLLEPQPVDSCANIKKRIRERLILNSESSDRGFEEKIVF